MALQTWWCNKGVIGGSGDGSSEANGYDSLFDLEAAKQQDLDAAEDIGNPHCTTTAGAADTESVTFEGWNTIAEYHLLVDTKPGDEAIKTGVDTDRYRLNVTDLNGFKIRVDFIRLENLQMISTFTSQSGQSCITVSSIAAVSAIHINSCRITNIGQSYGIEINDASATVHIFNTIFEGATGFAIRADNGTVNVLNSIVYNATAMGIRQTSATVTVINSVVFKTGNDFSGTFTINYCASDDNDGSNNVAESGGGAEWPDDFVDAAAGDFTLKATSNLKGAGLNDPGSGLYSTDMEGDSYVVDAWSLGVDEVVAVGGISMPLVMLQHNHFDGGTISG